MNIFLYTKRLCLLLIISSLTSVMGCRYSLIHSSNIVSRGNKGIMVIADEIYFLPCSIDEQKSFKQNLLEQKLGVGFILLLSEEEKQHYVNKYSENIKNTSPKFGIDDIYILPIELSYIPIQEKNHYNHAVKQVVKIEYIIDEHPLMFEYSQKIVKVLGLKPDDRNFKYTIR